MSLHKCIRMIFKLLESAKDEDCDYISEHIVKVHDRLLMSGNNGELMLEVTFPDDCPSHIFKKADPDGFEIYLRGEFIAKAGESYSYLFLDKYLTTPPIYNGSMFQVLKFIAHNKINTIMEDEKVYKILKSLQKFNSEFLVYTVGDSVVLETVVFEIRIRFLF
jgi:hypothetical protein